MLIVVGCLYSWVVNKCMALYCYGSIQLHGSIINKCFHVGVANDVISRYQQVRVDQKLGATFSNLNKI